MNGMEHRHLYQGETLSLAAIDDIIDRGKVADWRFLKERAARDSALLAKIVRVCAAKNIKTD